MLQRGDFKPGKKKTIEMLSSDCTSPLIFGQSEIDAKAILFALYKLSDFSFD